MALQSLESSAQIDAAPSLDSRAITRVVDAISFVTIAGLVAKLYYAYDRLRDVGLDDETVYLASGARFLVPRWPNGADGLPAADTGPLYSLWYLALSRVFRDGVTLYYASHALLVLFLGTALLALMRTLGVKPGWAVLLTALLLTSRLLDQWPYPTYLVAAVLLAGATWAARARTGRLALRALVVTFALASFVRPEVCTGFWLLAAVVVALGARELWRRRLAWRQAAGECLAFAPFAVLSAIFGSPLGGERSFYAFGQHYALNRVEAEHLAISPWTNWASFIERDFGHVKTIGQAARANPSAFAWHVWTNLAKTPRAIVRVFEPLLSLPEAPATAIEIAWGAFVTIGAVALLIGVVRRRRLPARMGAVALSVGLILVTTVGSVLIVHPRHHYFVPVGALAVAFLAAGVPFARVRARTPQAWTARRAWRGIGGSLLVCAGCLLFTPNRAYGDAPQTAGQVPPAATADLHRLRTIAALRTLPLPEHVVILEPAWGFAFLAGLDFDRVAPWEKNEPLAAFIAHRRIDVVILDDALTSDVRFHDDPEVAQLAAHPESMGFQIVDVPGTASRIAFKRP